MEHNTGRKEERKQNKSKEEWNATQGEKRNETKEKANKTKRNKRNTLGTGRLWLTTQDDSRRLEDATRGHDSSRLVATRGVITTRVPKRLETT